MLALKPCGGFLCLSIFVISCSEHSMMEKSSLDADAENEALDNMVDQQLRIDILPNSTDNDLMPQSIYLDPDTDQLTGLELKLNQTIWLTGQVQGFELFPHTETTPPGSIVPVASQIVISKSQSIAGGVFSSDENGVFSIPIPADTEYQMTVSPLAPSELPFFVSESLDLLNSQETNLELGFGLPVYGTITGLGEWAPMVDVQLIDAHTGIKGAPQALDSQGRFMLRAPSDRPDLQLRLQSSNDEWACPTINLPFRLEPEQQSAHEITLEMGDLNMVEVTGRIFQSDGSRFYDRADIRFTSLDLTDLQGALTVESSNDGEGDFSVTLLPGSWHGEFIPPFGDDFSAAPIEFNFEVPENETDFLLGDINLRSKVRIVGQVANHNGAPEAAVIVSLKEQSFKNYVYSVTTDPEGRFELMAPSVRYDTTLTPSLGNSAITHFSIPAPEDGQDIQWILQEGQPVQGVVKNLGDPVSYAMIEIWNGEKKLADSITSEDGSFSLRIQTDE